MKLFITLIFCLGFSIICWPADRCPDGVASGLASTKWHLDGRLNQTSEGIYSNGSLNGSGVGQSVYEVISAYENVTGKPIPRYIEKKRLGDVEVSFANTHLSAQMMGWSPKQTLSDMCRDSYKSCSS